MATTPTGAPPLGRHKTSLSGALPCLASGVDLSLSSFVCLITKESREGHTGTFVSQAHLTTAVPLAGLPSAPWGQSLVPEMPVHAADAHAWVCSRNTSGVSLTV